MTHEKLLIMAGLCLLLSSFGYGQDLWQTQEGGHLPTTGKRFVEPTRYQAFSANAAALRSHLFAAPHEDRIDNPLHSNLLLPVPMPDGSMDTFALVQYDMMEPELAERYPAFALSEASARSRRTAPSAAIGRVSDSMLKYMARNSTPYI